MPAKKLANAKPVPADKEAYYSNLSERSKRWRAQTLINQGEWLDRNEAVLAVLGDKIDELFWTALESDADTLYQEIDSFVPALKAVSELLMEVKNTRWFPETDVDQFDGSLKIHNRFACEEHRYTEVLPKLAALPRPAELDQK